MRVQFGSCRIELVHGDITEQEIDALIVWLKSNE